jgi:hypothetical protein
MYDKIYYPYPSTDKRFKYFIITDTGKKIRFGQYGAEDYTSYYKKEGKEIADERKRLYIIRHKKREEKKWNNPNNSSYWALKFLWSYPTKKEAYEKIKKDLLKLRNITQEQYNEYII